ncbi:hypothetical protein TcWFU_006972 [Taenia crassiceps]|uniref:Uncharacterized protein n=1 Tax=Taenia crassiceps TaxID=6207 RepID=A0ABR4Q5Q7_9CEST
MKANHGNVKGGIENETTAPQLPSPFSPLLLNSASSTAVQIPTDYLCSVGRPRVILGVSWDEAQGPPFPPSDQLIDHIWLLLHILHSYRLDPINFHRIQEASCKRAGR